MQKIIGRALARIQILFVGKTSCSLTTTFTTHRQNKAGNTLPDWLSKKGQFFWQILWLCGILYNHLEYR